MYCTYVLCVKSFNFMGNTNYFLKLMKNTITQIQVVFYLTQKSRPMSSERELQLSLPMNWPICGLEIWSRSNGGHIYGSKKALHRIFNTTRLTVSILS